MRIGTTLSRRTSPQRELLEEEGLAAQEAARRRRTILVIGGMMVLGTLLPDPVSRRNMGQYEFPLWGALADSSVPLTIKLLALYPLVAGLTCLGLCHRVRERLRGGILTFVALLPLMIVLADARFIEMFDRMLGKDVPVQVTWMGLVSMMIGMGYLSLFVGLRSRWYRPGNTVAATIAFSGGVLVIVAFLLPVLHGEQGYVIAAAPFVLLKQRMMGWFGCMAMLWVLAMATASIAAFALLLAKGARSVRAHANWAFWLMILGNVILIVGFVGCSRHLVMTMLKTTLLVTGTSLLLPLALIDLLVGDAPAPLRMRPSDLGQKTDPSRALLAMAAPPAPSPAVEDLSTSVMPRRVEPQQENTQGGRQNQ